MVQMYLSLMEDVFAQEGVVALKAQVAAAERVVITSHRSPDGDAIGSSLALQHALKKMGVTSKVVMPDAYAKFLHWMPGQEAVRFTTPSQTRCTPWWQGRTFCFVWTTTRLLVQVGSRTP